MDIMPEKLQLLNEELTATNAEIEAVALESKAATSMIQIYTPALIENEFFEIQHTQKIYTFKSSIQRALGDALTTLDNNIAGCAHNCVHTPRLQELIHRRNILIADIKTMQSETEE